MSCGRFEQRLHHLLDQRRAPAEDVALRRHAAVCPRCSRLLVAQERLFAGLEDSRPPLPGRNLVDHVVCAAQRLAVQHQRRRRRARRLAALSAAIGAAAVWFLAVRLSGPSPRPLAPQQLVVRPAPPAPEAVSRPAQPWPVLSLPLAYSGQITGGDSSAEITQRMKQWYRSSADRGLEPVSRLTGDLRPLATTVNAAFDTIVDVVRSDEPDLSPRP